MTTQDKRNEMLSKRAESMRRAWINGTGKLNGKKRQKQQRCKCGCGKLARIGRLYAKGCFDPGAAHRGKTRSTEWKAKQSLGLKRAYAEGKMQHAVNQTSEFIEKRVKSLRGRKLSKESCRAIGEAVRKAWKKGKYNTGNVGATRDQMTAIRGKRDMEKLKAENSERLKSKIKEWKQMGSLNEVRRKAGNAVGMLDHISAKVWLIRDPYGNPHTFSNLREWARNNTWRFDDDRPESKAPFWQRIASGIVHLLDAKGRSASYRGWTAVSKLELDAGGADLLGRDYFQQEAAQ